MQICKIRSDENHDKWFLVERKGKELKKGGKGIEWSCSCDYDGYLCKHLKKVFKAQMNPDILADESVRLFYDGKNFYQRTGLLEMDEFQKEYIRFVIENEGIDGLMDTDVSSIKDSHFQYLFTTCQEAMEELEDYVSDDKEDDDEEEEDEEDEDEEDEDDDDEEDDDGP